MKLQIQYCNEPSPGGNIPRALSVYSLHTEIFEHIVSLVARVETESCMVEQTWAIPPGNRAESV